ncbi:alanine--tRNA ligase [Candidatus Peregrinibacteria bacterium]|nr:alanine--tRNA ligase [Candidatus Peregrinibacteria bacterium]
MKANDLRRRFIDFFVSKGHAEIGSSSLIPENDPTVLFTTAGMHPLVPYLMGEEHPSGKRLVDVQKCIRTDDIDEVGDPTHCTFFEMLGNWSLGDYFKKEAIQWSYEFLTNPLEKGGIGLDPKRLMVTCFAGDSDAPRDDEAADIWETLGFKRYDKASPEDRGLIFFYEKKKNWWGPAGQTGPCGPDTEMFYDTCPELAPGEHKKGSSEFSQKKYELPGWGGKCHANCECGRFVEIWNDVFMQYNKQADGSYVPLKQQNVDTGMGLERVTAILQGMPSHYETELFAPLVEKIKELAKPTEADLARYASIADEELRKKTIELDTERSLRIIADHIRAATFIMGDAWSVSPSNTDQGYILRRLIRRAIRHGKMLGISGNFTDVLGQIVIDIYGEVYPELKRNQERIIAEYKREEEKFQLTIEVGLRELRKIWNEENCKKEFTVVDGAKAFYIYETYGFPIEMITEELKKIGYEIDQVKFMESFDKAMKDHQEKSRAGSEQKFAGGLADHSFECTMLHTATHLLHKALKVVLGDDVNQKGSNITAERLRFDFNYPQKMTPEQVKQTEDIVNEQIQRDLPVSYEIVTVEEAKQKGAIGLFEDRYGDKVKVYKMGDFSYEICGGPHVEHTGQLQKFKIKKEEACSAGIRRIKAVVVGAGM